MATSGGQKLKTFSQVAPGATVKSRWNNAIAEVYSLHAWPVVSAGVDASAQMLQAVAPRHRLVRQLAEELKRCPISVRRARPPALAPAAAP